MTNSWRDCPIPAEAAAKRDLPDAIAIAGSLQQDLHAALDLLLRDAQDAGAVRADIGTPELIVLLKGLIRSIQDASGSAMSDRILAVVADGLRRLTDRGRDGPSGSAQARLVPE